MHYYRVFVFAILIQKIEVSIWNYMLGNDHTLKWPSKSALCLKVNFQRVGIANGIIVYAKFNILDGW